MDIIQRIIFEIFKNASLANDSWKRKTKAVFSSFSYFGICIAGMALYAASSPWYCYAAMIFLWAGSFWAGLAEKDPDLNGAATELPT